VNLTGKTISATATDPNGNTSEFAKDVTVSSGSGSTVTVALGDTPAATQAVLQAVVSYLQNLPAGTAPPPVLLQVTSVAELDSVVAAINGIMSQSSPPITVNVDLGGTTYQADTKLDPPSGIDVMIKNGHLVGGSPALIVTGGSVTLNNITVTNATSAPTILVSGGSLTVRNSTIDGSPVVGEAAFSITGGTLDLGTVSSPGGNTISISTDDQFVQNATSTPIPTVGDTFTVSGAVQAATELSFTSLSGPASPSAHGQSVTFTATVVPDYPGDPAPTGYVYFVDLITGMTLGMTTLHAGQAVLPTSVLPVGSNEIVARYFGDSRYLLSISGTFNQTVTAATALSVTSIASVSPNPRNTPVPNVDVTFNEAVSLATFSDSALTLTDNGGPNLINGSVAMSLVSGSTYQISGLSGFTAAQGEYTLTVNAAHIQDQSGSAGTNSLSTQWLMDTAPPSSTVSPLPARETSLNFPVSVTGSDHGSPPSGIASYEIYSSTNGGPWSFWTTVPASNPSASFTGQSDTTYSFYSTAADSAGNWQAYKPLIEASTYVPNLTPPVTTVDGSTGTNPSTVNTSAGTFTLNLTGSHPGGGRVTYFEVFVSIDAAAYQQVGPYAIPAGPPDSQGIFHSTVPFQGLTDGKPHSYAFYSVGLDSAGNRQSAPSSPNVSFANQVFAQPAQLQVTSFTVEHDSPSRSFIRYLDIGFNESNSQSGSDLSAIVNSIGTASPDILIYKYDLNGDASSKTAVPLSSPTALDVLDHAIEIDFGASGLGGSPSTTAADGYYEVHIKLPGGQTSVHHFYRLLGDVDGDGIVDQNDLNEIAASINETSPLGWTPLSSDVTGSGAVTARELTIATRSKNHKLGNGLSLG
jgi:Bacterial Ig-like domain (group 3)